MTSYSQLLLKSPFCFILKKEGSYLHLHILSLSIVSYRNKKSWRGWPGIGIKYNHMKGCSTCQHFYRGIKEAVGHGLDFAGGEKKRLNAWRIYHILSFIISWQMHCPVNKKASATIGICFLSSQFPLKAVSYHVVHHSYIFTGTEQINVPSWGRCSMMASFHGEFVARFVCLDSSVFWMTQICPNLPKRENMRNHDIVLSYQRCIHLFKQYAANNHSCPAKRKCSPYIHLFTLHNFKVPL